MRISKCSANNGLSFSSSCNRDALCTREEKQWVGWDKNPFFSYQGRFNCRHKYITPKCTFRANLCCLYSNHCGFPRPEPTWQPLMSQSDKLIGQADHVWRLWASTQEGIETQLKLCMHSTHMMWLPKSDVTDSAWIRFPEVTRIYIWDFQAIKITNIIQQETTGAGWGRGSSPLCPSIHPLSWLEGRAMEGLPRLSWPLLKDVYGHPTVLLSTTALSTHHWCWVLNCK